MDSGIYLFRNDEQFQRYNDLHEQCFADRQSMREFGLDNRQVAKAAVVRLLWLIAFGGLMPAAPVGVQFIFLFRPMHGHVKPWHKNQQQQIKHA